jgi:hypothetical protein
MAGQVGALFFDILQNGSWAVDNEKGGFGRPGLAARVDTVERGSLSRDWISLEKVGDRRPPSPGYGAARSLALPKNKRRQ